MRGIKATTFDWDATLEDSANLGLLAFQNAFAEMGVAFPQDLYEAHYSPNWYSIYEAMSLPRDKWGIADQLWLKHYGEQTAPLLNGAAETVLTLKSKGYRLGVVSSGSESRVRRELDLSRLAEVFAALICNEHIVNKKPHPEGLELALRRLNSKPDESVYVGDAAEDVQMGKRARVLTVGVRSNYPSSARLLSSNPDLYLESLNALVNYF